MRRPATTPQPPQMRCSWCDTRVFFPCPHTHHCPPPGTGSGRKRGAQPPTPVLCTSPRIAARVLGGGTGLKPRATEIGPAFFFGGGGVGCPSPSLALSLSVSVSLFVCLSLSFCLCLSLPFSFFVFFFFLFLSCLSLSLCLCLFLSISFCLSLSLFVPLSLSLSFSLSFSLSLFLSLSLLPSLVSSRRASHLADR